MSVSAILQSVLLLFHPRFQARQIQIVDDCAAETRIQCFSDEIRQDFVNLVSNAFDATPDGGRLRVRIRNASLNRVPGVHVTVSDSGSGILLPIQKHIFEPFFSTKDTTGIGLGLWVSESIIREHAGHISLRSCTSDQQHQGAVFSLFFPHNGIE